jgi:hypothetical protein
MKEGCPVRKVEEYREHASECRTMANRSRSAEEKAMLTTMANTWDSLAKEREAHIARQKRLAALEGKTGDQEKTATSIPIDKLNASNDD